MVRFTMAVTLSLTLSASGALAQEGEARSLDKRYRELALAFAQAYSTVLEEHRSASDEQKPALWAKLTSLPPEYAAKFLILAKEGPETEAGFQAMNWIVTRTAISSGGKPLEQSLEMLLKHHVQHPDMGNLCARLAYSNAKQTDALLEAVMEQHKSRDVRAFACMGYAGRHKRIAERSTNDHAAGLALQAYQRILDNYADVKYGRRDIAEIARGGIYELKFLSPGKMAPEIEGEDLDGVKFKLSDYRGKVVMLDFWGHW
jgi:hypothetical protein